MTHTRLAVVDQGEANERILNKEEHRADFRKVEGASLKRKTQLASPEAKRMFARCFYSFQASMYFISQLGRTKLNHAVVERIEEDVRAALEAGTKEINEAIDHAEALLKHNQIETLASYDTVPLVEDIGITSSFGRRYFDMLHKLDLIMPMMETLAIEEIITEREHEVRRSRYKRIVLSMSTKARNFWTGVRRRMNEHDAKLLADAAKGKGPGRQAPATQVEGAVPVDARNVDVSQVEPTRQIEPGVPDQPAPVVNAMEATEPPPRPVAVA